MIVTLLLLILAYLLGSIPFGLILSTYIKKEDIRQKGSGNIGATNITRIYGKRLGAITLLCDAIKGSMAVLAAYMITKDDSVAAWCGLVVVFGHMYPCWLHFKGGKGVATTFGALLFIYWPLFIVMALSWLLAFFMARISSLSAIVAMLVTVVLSWVYAPYGTSLQITIMCLWVIAKHRPNIERLLQGQEH